MIRFYWLVLGALAVWRMTHLFVAEDGPWDALARLRRALHPGFWGKLVSCFYCLSLWLAAPVAVWVGENWPERVLLWLALSGAATLLERATKVEPAIYHEDPEGPAVPNGQSGRPGSVPPTGDPPR